jgi:hypothetical protein
MTNYQTLRCMMELDTLESKIEKHAIWIGSHGNADNRPSVLQ